MPTSTRSTRRSSSATTRALRGRPVIVGGGVVLAASYEAKAFGVRTAMGGAQARRLCPNAVVVPPRMAAYSEASKAVFEVFDDTTPLVEGLSIDEAFLDVGGLRRVVGHAGRDRRPAARRGARAGRAADHGRRRPHQVPRQGGQRRGQARRAARRRRPAASWRSSTRCRSSGCGASAPMTAAKLHERGITTVGDVAVSARRRSCRCSGRSRPPPARPRPQPRPAAGRGRPAPAVDRLAARPRPRRQVRARRTSSTPSSSASSTA